MLPALFSATGLFIAISVQYMASPIAGTWLLFHIAACAVMLKDGYPKVKGVVWYCSLAWLVALSVSTFILAPVVNGAAYLAVLAAAPLTAICMQPRHLKPTAICFAVVLAIYAIGLVAQELLQVQYTYTNEDGAQGRAWPLLDPNNAAAVINCGLIPAVYLAMKRPRYFWLVALFAAALYTTNSRAGVVAAVIGCTIATRIQIRFLALAVGVFLIVSSPFIWWPDVLQVAYLSFSHRFPIWEASLPLLTVRPFDGLGLGSFGHYYQQVRTETYTAGSFAHNDLLQFAIEMGIPLALVFCGLVVSMMRRFTPASAVFIAIFAQAMVEFQFYVPAISILLGLAIAFQIQTKEYP